MNLNLITQTTYAIALIFDVAICEIINEIEESVKNLYKKAHSYRKAKNYRLMYLAETLAQYQGNRISDILANSFDNRHLTIHLRHSNKCGSY